MAVAYSVAIGWLVIGTAYRIGVWLRSQVRFRIPLAPAPRSTSGVVLRLCVELFAFRSLARASKTTWLAAMLFHYGLLWMLIVHLRFVFRVLPGWLVPFIQFSGWATLCLVCGLAVLLVRRCVVDRLRYISSPSDYLHVLLLIGIALSGTLLKRVWPADLYATGEFLRGALTLRWVAAPDHAGLLLHLSLVLILILVFPVSKLLHGIGIVFSPTFNQRDRS